MSGHYRQTGFHWRSKVGIMAETIFGCPNCSQRLQYEEELAGQEVECPTCNSRVALPPPVPQAIGAYSGPDEFAQAEGDPGTLTTEPASGSVSGRSTSEAQEPGHLDSWVAPTEAELRAFVGPHASYYIERWSAGLVSERKSGWAWWNWAAVLVPGVWLAYRKLYLMAGFAWGLTLLFVHGAGRFLGGPKTSRTVVLLLVVGFAASANQLYFEKAKRTIARLRGRRLSRQEHLAALARRGGTSLAGSVVFSLASIAAIICILVFLQYAGWLSPYGTRLTFNSAHLFYQWPVREEQARKLGDYLVASEVIQQGPATMQLLQVRDVMHFRIVVKEGAHQNTSMVEAFKALGSQLSKAVFDSKPVQVHLCDRNLDTVLSLPPTN